MLAIWLDDASCKCGWDVNDFPEQIVGLWMAVNPDIQEARIFVSMTGQLAVGTVKSIWVESAGDR